MLSSEEIDGFELEIDLVCFAEAYDGSDWLATEVRPDDEFEVLGVSFRIHFIN